MNQELERFQPSEASGRIAYEHLHRYAICRDMVAGQRVLDVGCGAGYGTNILAQTAAQATGIDIDAGAIRLAQKDHKRDNLKFTRADCFELPFEEAAFDAVVANEMIEHIDDQDRLLQEVKRVLRPGGILLVSTPNKPVYNRYRTPNPFHVSEMDISEFRDLLGRHFEQVHVTGLRMALVSASFLIDGVKHHCNLAAAKTYRGVSLGEGQPDVTNDELALVDPEYVLACCSDRPIEEEAAHSTIFYSNDDDLWLEHEKIMAWASKLHEEDEVLRADLRRIRSELEVSTAALDEERQAKNGRFELSHSEYPQHMAISSRLLSRMTGRQVEADAVSMVEAMFSLNEQIVSQRARLDTLSEARQRAAELERELKNSEVIRERLLEDARRAQLIVDDLNRAQKATQDERDRLTSEAERLQQLLTEATQVQNKVREERDELVREVNHVNQLMEGLRRDHEKVLEERDLLIGEVDRKGQLIADLEGKQDEIRKEKYHLTDETERLQQLLMDSTQDQDKVREERDELVREVNRSGHLIADLERKQNDVAEERDSLIGQLRDGQFQNEKISSDLRALTDEFQQLKERAGLELKEAREELAELRLKLERADQQRRALLKQIEEAPKAQLRRKEAAAAKIAGAQRRRQMQLADSHREVQAQLSNARIVVRNLVQDAPAPRRVSTLRRLTNAHSLATTSLFDRKWVQSQVPDRKSPSFKEYLHDPALHRIDPHPLFAAVHYLDRNPDVVDAGVSPLQHYLEHGWREGRDPHPYFANDWYLQQNPDVLNAGINPLEHYLRYGWREGRWPNPVFDPAAYLARHGDVRAAGIEPLTHYVLYGRGENREIPFHGLERDWRSVLSQSRETFLIDHLLLDEVAVAEPRIEGKCRAARLEAWPPDRLNDYWLPQRLRDFIVDTYGEETVRLHWFLCSVMDAFLDDPDAFPSSETCKLILGRIQDKSMERASSQDGKPAASVIIPVYNNFLDTLLCLASIFELESDSTFEVIIADDGSNDATLDIASTIGGVVRYIRQPENLGFVGNCNTAAEEAEGETIVLLNNDTLVLPGWLDALLAPFDRSELVGLVGSKLINWDGTLQEAGGIFWKDGSAWNFGRGGDARDPAFNYLKETDYCSGASIAVPATLWRQMDGFDPAFAPAYCEDSDLAFRIRAAGYRTLYNPQSEVIHHEGRSHGRDINSGIKAHQVTNQKRLRERWGDTLAREHFSNAQNVLRARDRSRNKIHVLVIDHYVPQWDQDAGSRTIYQYIEIFLDLGFQVSFWPDNLYRDPVYAPALQAMGVEVIYGPQFLGAFAEFIRERGELYDAVFVSRPHVAVEYLSLLKEHSQARVLYYGHDLHFRRMEASRLLGQQVDPTKIEEMRDLELRVCRDCDVIFYPDPEEIKLLAREIGGDRSFIANPVFVFDEVQIDEARIRLGTIPSKVNNGLLFVGGFNHAPNREGIVWFVNEVLPLVVEQISDVKLDIAGSNPPPDVAELASNHVAILGRVSDERLRDLYDDASMAVAPLRYGAGVKGKVIEAMALGVPIATTSTGAQGIDVFDKGLFIADTPRDLANEIIRCLSDRAEAQQRAKRSLEFIKHHYARTSMMELFHRLIVEEAQA